MFEIGDTVRQRGNQDIRTVTGIGSDGFLMTQIGRDGATVKMVNATDLELVAKAPQPDRGLPKRSITDDGC